MRTSGNPYSAGEAVERARQDRLVHEIRKAIKRMRAFARVQRHGLGEWEFGRVDTSLRATGRRLSRPRDAQVRQATLEQLTRRHPELTRHESIGRLREQLQRERKRESERTLEPIVLEELGQMRCELARWRCAPYDFQTLDLGLRRIYAEGRKHHKRAARRATNDVEALHDWRKRVKSLYYALDMLGGADASGARASTRRAKRIGDLLGEEHDLWLLTAYATEHPHLFDGNRHALSVLLAQAEHRRERLRNRALSRGARLYKRKPSTFARHMRIALARP